MEKFNVFVRNWWKNNPSYPDGLEPGPGPKTFLENDVSYEEARRLCKEYNSTHEPGRLSRKAEFMEV